MKLTSGAALLAFLVIFSASSDARAQVQAGAIPEFIPSSPWVIGESGLGEARGLPVKLPCMMANQYDNGFVVRFAGGGNQLTAMAIDFRQNIFTPGMRYPAAIYTDAGFGGAVQGSAFNGSTLVFNLRDAGDVYGALRGARLFGLSMGQNDMRFSLNNFAQGLSNLEGCYGGGAPASQQQNAMAPAPAAPAAQAPFPTFDQTPTTLAEIQQKADDEAHSAGREVYIKRGEKQSQPAGPRMNVNGVMKSTGEQQPSRAAMGSAMGAWNARAGESLQEVVSRWSHTAGVELQWQASNGGGAVAQDFAHSGSFNDAVAALLAENAAASGLKSNYDAGTSPRANAPTFVADAPPMEIEPRQSSADPTSAYAQGVGGRGGQWRAPKGGSLQSVLQQWAAQSDVELLWYATGGYPVKNDINQGGSFESALQTILQSYESDNNRPVARLNTDPGTGRKVLVVESDRTL